MREIVIVSGKGGTGKTSLTAAFSSLAKNSVFCDADVDAADLHLLLKPEIIKKEDFIAGGIAQINEEDCVQCGTCLELCKFGAISDEYVVDSMRCEGCGVCVDLCPAKAIDFPPTKCGEWFVSSTRNGPMVHAKLGIAQENSGRLVSLIRKETRDLAVEKKLDLIVTDGPPGIGCPVIASITGATVILIVVEPTVSGEHDMLRVAKLARHFKLPSLICINKYDVNEEMSLAIEQQAKDLGMGLAGKIPFDSDFTKSMVAEKTLIEMNLENDTSSAIVAVWKVVEELSAKVYKPINIIPSI